MIAGDGIGPEVIEEGVKVLKEVAKIDGRFAFEFTYFPWGCEYYKETGRMMPENGIERYYGKGRGYAFRERKQRREYARSGSWLFKGKPNEVVIQDGVFSRKGCERVIRYAYELARKENKTLTSISKGNALNYTGSENLMINSLESSPLLTITNHIQ